MGLVQNIKIACIRNGTSIVGLEDALGFARGTINRWDDKKPMYKRVVRTARQLNCTVEDLVDGVDLEEE